MSTNLPTPEQSGDAFSLPRTALKPPRILACLLCQQRKVKCDRKSPCNNCVKNGMQCVSAALATRQRRRRFPERELLDRLRDYEQLLRQNNITFEPLHKLSEESPMVFETKTSSCSIQDTGRGVGPSNGPEVEIEHSSDHRAK